MAISHVSLTTVLRLKLKYLYLEKRWYLRDSFALVDALWEAEVLADSDALVEALCEAEALVETLCDAEMLSDTDTLIESEIITLLISMLSRE